MGNECNSGKDACCSSGKGCESQCGCGGQAPCPSEYCDCPGCKLAMVAKKAKINVLIRKMEAIIEKEHGKTLDAEAKIVVEHVMKSWKMQMENKEMTAQENEEYGKKLMAAMKE
jgi:hypothetical protein